MSQEIEIEYKTLVTKQEFDRLLQELKFPNVAIKQVNHYFETENFSLKNNHSALRIREKTGNYTLTLKEPHEEGILETHDSLTYAEFAQWIKGHPVSKKNVAKQLTNLHISVVDLRYVGSLETERRSFTSNEVLYVLDKSTYNGIVDYELEMEAPTKNIGKYAFQQVIADYAISQRQSITKIERFFSSLPSQ